MHLIRLPGGTLCELADCAGYGCNPWLSTQSSIWAEERFRCAIICSARLSTATVIHQNQLDHNLVDHFTVLGSLSGYASDSSLSLGLLCTRLWSRFAWLSAY